MCGRYTLHHDTDAVAARFAAQPALERLLPHLRPEGCRVAGDGNLAFAHQVLALGVLVAQLAGGLAAVDEPDLAGGIRQDRPDTYTVANLLLHFGKRELTGTLARESAHGDLYTGAGCL